jgi:hypothetical protein
MIQAINICAFALGIAGVAIFNVRAHRLFSKTDAGIRKYKLFRVRDNLVRLVAEGQLREDDFVFEFFYRAVDFLIKHTDHLNLKSVVQVLREAQKRGIDPAAAQALERINNKLPQEPPEVREVVSDFYATMAQVLMENSFVIRFIVNHSDLWRAAADLGRVLGSLFSTERLAYRFYEAYKNAARTTAHAT